MSLNNTPSGERIHIGFFGMRNAGKSSVVNAVTGQELSVVSDVKGTTTDPVKKAMELLPIGPVVIIDTPGMDDEGDLGELRVQKARRMLAETAIAVLVVDGTVGLSDGDRMLLDLFKEKKLPYVIAYNNSDLDGFTVSDDGIAVSAATGEGITELKEKIGSFAKKMQNDKKIVSDLLEPGDLVVLVIPIDDAAPKGRLILPQQQTLRDVLDAHCTVVCCQDTELKETLASLAKKPKLVITDSQAFGRVSKDTPDDILLTSFSILFARYKGDLAELVRGAAMLSKIQAGDRVLISEGCTHHRQCGDIGTVKMPAWIEKFTGVKPEYTFTSGGEFPEDLSEYKVCVHCGGCMLNEQEMGWRITHAKESGTPIVNYGIAIAQMHGILRRSLEPFPEILALLEE
ncbi:MAG: [Clostridia bacterium]|nr:[FeFe] hydrogenase H-cluster maturation GTPase HydF [Clostridia bacterium]